MYLKELELQGFKSFPEKVKLDFNKGITAVVGPNGSGKSNISDSVRWVLGEQKAKSLRGGKMEDVIFAGTANRRPVGFAEVSMTLDNTDKKINMDYSEIKVTRRVYRSGESSYLINGSECRLKDIYELFMDTGIGRDGYSIIGQGKIDEILSNKSEDRRLLFEEAAGIVKYKNRRNEAENKLEKEKQNLVRINDIISEIESKIEPLEKQAEKAKKYLELYADMKDADIKLFKINGKKLEEDILKAKDDLDNIKQETCLHEENLDAVKIETENIKSTVEQLSLEMEEINRTIAELSGEIEKNEGICALTAEQIKNLKDTVSELGEEKIKKEEHISENEAEIAVCEKNAAYMLNSVNKLKAELDEKETVLKEMVESQSRREEKIDSLKADMIENIKKTADIKSALERTETLLEQFASRQNQIENEKKELDSKIKDKKIQSKSIELKAEQCSDELEELSKESKKLENKKSVAVKVADNIRQGLGEKNSKLSEKQSKLKVLSDMEREHDGYYKSVKAVLQLKENGNPNFKGVRGAVAQLFKTDEKYETAIETALGGSMQSIVVDNENDAKYAVGYLKLKQLGRATFLPISTVKGKSLGTEKERLLNEPGIVAVASELVKYDKEYTGIAESLLGRILVVDTMDNAISFARRHNQGYRLVTLEGESFMPGGAITGGSTGKKSNVFGRKREIDYLKSDIEALQAAVDGLTAELEKNSAKIEEIDEYLENGRKKSSEVNIDFITAEREAESVKKEISEYEEKTRLIIIESQQLEKQKEAVEKEKKEKQAELKEVETEIIRLQQTLNDFRDNSENGKNGRESISDEITAAKIKISALNEKRQFQLDSIRRLSEEKTKFSEEIVLIESRRQKAYEQISEKEETAKNAAEIIRLQQTLNDFRDNSENGKNGRESISDEITAAKIKISALNEKRQFQLDSIRRLSEEKTKFSEEIVLIESRRQKAYEQISEKEETAKNAAEMTEKSKNSKIGKEQELLEITQKRKDENGKMSVNENRINDFRETILHCKNETVRLEIKLEKLEEENKRLNDEMWDSYEITYPEAAQLFEVTEPTAELMKRVRSLKAEIKLLGNVNVNAVDEYRETKERYEFLSKQKNDIIEAEEKLKEIIKDLSELMEKQFRQNLEIISENFNEVFREMFGGGKAYLKLSDEDDVLGSGIDIIAQPPGKNLQNMMLLSGGERALTAIAILFSILKMKPSPFCILDEIEAALDDANVQRFGDYLKRFSKDTQFIVITHRKGTMEAADVIYGVTMQEHGVSKIVSVKFDEAVGQ